LEDKAKSLDKAECPCTIKTERLQKTNKHLDDIMRMIKFGTFIQKKPKDEETEGAEANQPSGTWMANCKLAARKISGFTGNKITGPRKIIRNEGAWCAELWRNPGKYSKPFKRPDGSTGTTSGMKLRTAVGKPGFKLPASD